MIRANREGKSISIDICILFLQRIHEKSFLRPRTATGKTLQQQKTIIRLIVRYYGENRRTVYYITRHNQSFKLWKAISNCICNIVDTFCRLAKKWHDDFERGKHEKAENPCRNWYIYVYWYFYLVLCIWLGRRISREWKVVARKREGKLRERKFCLV